MKCLGSSGMLPPAHAHSGSREGVTGLGDGRRLWPVPHRSAAVPPDFGFRSQAAPRVPARSIFL